MSGTAPSSAPLAHELRESIGRFVRRMRAEPGPPLGRMMVMARIERMAPCSISELAVAEGIRPQSMAQAVRELEAAALVERRRDPTDGRRMSIELTGAGRDLLQVTRTRREGWLSHVLEEQLDQREREVLRAALGLLDRIARA